MQGLHSTLARLVDSAYRSLCMQSCVWDSSEVSLRLAGNGLSMHSNKVWVKHRLFLPGPFSRPLQKGAASSVQGFRSATSHSLWSLHHRHTQSALVFSTLSTHTQHAQCPLALCRPPLQHVWHLRIRFLARAGRLGYNVMNVDADVIFFHDPYPFLVRLGLHGRRALPFGAPSALTRTGLLFPCVLWCALLRAC